MVDMTKVQDTAGVEVLSVAPPQSCTLLIGQLLPLEQAVSYPGPSPYYCPSPHNHVHFNNMCGNNACEVSHGRLRYCEVVVLDRVNSNQAPKLRINDHFSPSIVPTSFLIGRRVWL